MKYDIGYVNEWRNLRAEISDDTDVITNDIEETEQQNSDDEDNLGINNMLSENGDTSLSRR